MSIKYFISVILLILLINIHTVAGQIDNRVMAETITPVKNPSVTAFPSVTPLSSGLTDKTPVAEMSPLTATQSPDSTKVPSVTPLSSDLTDKTPVAEMSPLTATQSPDSTKVPSVTPLSSGLTPVSDKTPVAEMSPLTATQSPDSNAVPSVTPATTSVPSVKVTVSDKRNVPVTFYGEELFSINIALGPYSVEERANIISSRLIKVVEDPNFQTEAITVEMRDSYPCIVYKNIIIMTVSDEDGKPSGMTDRQVAGKYANKFRNVLREYKKARSLRSIIWGSFFFLITTVIFILIFKISDRVLRLIYKKLDSWHGTRIRDIKIQRLVLLPGDKIVKTSFIIIKFLYFLVKMVFFYIYLSVVFSFFIWTRGLSAKLLLYILSGLNFIWLGFLSYLPQLLSILVTVIITYYVIKFIRFIFTELEKGTISLSWFDRDWAKPTYLIIRFLVIALAAVIIFPNIPGYDTPAFRGISIFLGVLFSLGSTAVVSNIMAGIILIYMNAFKTGDRVKIGDVTGDIVEKTLLLTRIRTIKNVDITLPNAVILGNYITNYSSSSQALGLILHTTVTIGYDAPWKDVHKLLIDAALSTKDILREPPPFVFQTSLDDFYVSYQINAYTREPNSMAIIYSDLHQNIQDKFNEGNVEIMSPHYRAMRDGNQTTIPADYLPETYTSPTFKIKLTTD